MYAYKMCIYSLLIPLLFNLCMYAHIFLIYWHIKNNKISVFLKSVHGGGRKVASPYITMPVSDMGTFVFTSGDGLVLFMTM